MRCTQVWNDPYYSHVSTWANHGQGYNAERLTMGENNSAHSSYNKSCFAYTTYPGDPDLFMMLGGGYTPTPPDQAGNIAVMINWACRSAYYYVWAGGGLDSVRAGTMGMWNGWHSHGQISSTWVGAFKTYLAYAMSSFGAGEQWVDMSTYSSTFSHKHDHCLASVVWGTNYSDIVNRFHNTKLAGTNLPYATNPTLSIYFYYAGCSPYPYYISGVRDPDGLDLLGTRNSGLIWTFKYGS